MSADIRSLLDDVKQERPLSFETIYRLYLPLIDSLTKINLRRFSLSESEADDLRQEAAIALYNAAKAYEADQQVPFGAYAKVCLQNRMVSYIRSFRKIVPTEPLPENDTELSELSDVTPEQFVLNKESLSTLNRQIESILTPFEKSVFDLYVESTSYEDMARALAKPRKSIDNAICRIKAKLRKLL